VIRTWPRSLSRLAPARGLTPELDRSRPLASLELAAAIAACPRYPEHPPALLQRAPPECRTKPHPGGVLDTENKLSLAGIKDGRVRVQGFLVDTMSKQFLKQDKSERGTFHCTCGCPNARQPQAPESASSWARSPENHVDKTFPAAGRLGTPHLVTMARTSRP
jgi:hypothetical protein